ncbi:RiPP maturation radical SAM C-methyltransferase [Thermodesulfobacteriota bacterium]
MKAAKKNHRIILVSTPWALFNRPSIQLGTLKAYLESQDSNIEVEARHFYLKVAETIGYKLYQAISERTWLAESVYAALLYPEREELIRKVFQKEATGSPIIHKTGFKTLHNRVKEVSEDFISRTDWHASGLIGFSICMCQFTSTIYFIKRIKQENPALNIVVGGSLIVGEEIGNLLDAFPEIDFIVNGEGERPLARLVRHLHKSLSPADITDITGVFTRKNAPNRSPVSFSQMENIDHLPMPDYDDYFNLLRTFSPQKTFFPTLSAETSRGCWWRRSSRFDKRTGCAFCNLNLQWEGYRSKTPEKVVNEIDQLTAKYQILSVAFMDNLLPVKTSPEIFTKLSRLKKDFNLFGEIRATTSKSVLRAMQTAGTREVQIGIEALSSGLLKKMNKGTTAIQNLEIMKNCEELGIANASNLLLCFPGSDELDVAETIRTLEFAMPFRPLRFVHFWLGFGSPVFENPCAFGIQARYNHPNYFSLFPARIARSMRFMIQAYRGDLTFQRKIWQPVKNKVRAWEKTYAELRKGSTPILTFRDGREFLIIRQLRMNADPLTHRLTGSSRAIYLYCRRHRSLQRILNTFPGIPGDQIVRFLNMMVDKRLMFEEKGRYLSLAIRVKSH